MKFLQLSAMALSLAVCMGLSSCSDDKDEPNGGGEAGKVATAYENGVPSQIGDVKLTVGADGRVTSMRDEDDECNVTIKYGAVSRATNYDGTITISEWDEDGDIVFYFQLNDKGFIKYALEIESDGGQEEWWFNYNADNQLNYMKRTEGDNEVTNITYADGNITSVKMRDDNDEGGDWTISYGTTKIENKGCLMLFDETFGIDMDEMKYGYIAGLLGKATKNLPASNHYVGHNSDWDSEDTETYTWTLNANGFPTKLVSTETPGNYTEDMTFVW